MFVKIATRATEPLRVKGTLAHPRAKKDGPGEFMECFKSIGIRSVIVKIHHIYIRNIFKQAIAGIIFPTQCGGITKRSTTMTSAHLKWTVAAACHEKVHIQV